MARVCQSLWECCPSLQLLFTGLSGGAGEAQQMGGRGPAVGTAGGGGGVGSPVAQRCSIHVTFVCVCVCVCVCVLCMHACV